jgi:phosphoglycerate kinase
LSFNKKTIKDIELDGKTVLVRADYNVPLSDDGEILSDFRLKQSIKTLSYLQSKDCKIVICSHLGRPESAEDKEFSLEKVAKRLSELLGQNVGFVNKTIGEEVKQRVGSLGRGEIIVLENLRFHKQEEDNDDSFAKELADLADVFVQDGFGVIHRAHASIAAITNHLESVAGLVVEEEVSTILHSIDEPDRPLLSIVAGAKISDKIEVVRKLIERSDYVALGGAMANTFLVAKGHDIGGSKYEPDEVDTAREVMELAKEKSKDGNFGFYMPQDSVVATSNNKQAKTRIVEWDDYSLSSIQSYPNKPEHNTSNIQDGEMVMDIGPLSAAFISGLVQQSGTVIWNGTLGVTETRGVQGPVGPFSHGTYAVAQSMMGYHGRRPFVLVGGGDTAGYVDEEGFSDRFGYVSTGGGATLMLMAGESLIGIDVLPDKQ